MKFPKRQKRKRTDALRHLKCIIGGPENRSSQHGPRYSVLCYLADFDPQEFKKLLGLEHVKSTGKRAHNYDIPLERIEQLKKEYKKVWGEVPTVLDPFAGGGSIPFEAMRVGVDADRE